MPWSVSFYGAFERENLHFSEKFQCEKFFSVDCGEIYIYVIAASCSSVLLMETMRINLNSIRLTAFELDVHLTGLNCKHCVGFL